MTMWTGCGAHNFSPAHLCSRCREDRCRAAEEREARAGRFTQALEAVREAWREEGGDYYPLTQRIADEYEVDVWALRDEWLRPYHAARRALAESAAMREP